MAWIPGLKARTWGALRFCRVTALHGNAKKRHTLALRNEPCVFRPTAILGFVGCKMLFAKWINVPVAVSLAFIVTVVLVRDRLLH